MSVVGVAAPVAAAIIASAEVSCCEEVSSECDINPIALDSVAYSIRAGSKEIREFKSLLNDFGLRILVWGFSSSA